MEKIELTIIDTPYTIDTYSTFTTDHAEEYLLEAMREENPDIVYDDIDWNYDHEGHIQALAENCVALMNKNICDNVIKSITLNGKAYSPKEYNFTTDNAPISITYNEEALAVYIEEHREKYEKEKRQSYDGYMWLGDERDNELQWYMKTASTALYSIEDYYMDQNDNDQVDAYTFLNYEVMPFCQTCRENRTSDGECRDCRRVKLQKQRQAVTEKEERFLLSVGITREAFASLTQERKKELKKAWDLFEA